MFSRCMLGIYKYNVLYANGRKRCVITDLCRCFVFFFSCSSLWPVGKYGIFGAWGWCKQNKAAAAASALPFQADIDVQSILRCLGIGDCASLLYPGPHLHPVKCVVLEAVRMWTSEVKAEMPSSRLVWTQAMFRKAESSITLLKHFQCHLPLASKKFMLSSVRNDVALPPLRPGIVSKGLLPKGSRLSGLFESRSKPHVSIRNTLPELYACWTCWMSGWRDLWSKSRWSLALRPQDRERFTLSGASTCCSSVMPFSLKIVFCVKENSDRLPVLAALPGVLLGFFPSSRSAPMCCHDSLSMILRKLQFHIIALGGHLSIGQLHQQPAAALWSCA